MDTIARVRRTFHAQGCSTKKISRELHVSRNTVRNILRSGETDFTYEREHQPLPKIGPWVEHGKKDGKEKAVLDVLKRAMKDAGFI